MKYLSFFVFWNGMAIMAVEMAASRFLAPYFGSSTIVWANIIGVIMAAMAVGYSIGGRIADQFPSKKVFFSIGLMGALLLSSIPIVIQLVLNPLTGSILSLPAWEIIGSFLIALFFFGVPIAFLSLLSPFAVRLANRDMEHVGAKTGKLYAWSTIGSILGVYLSTFIQVPFWGVAETIYFYAGSLLLLSLYGFSREQKMPFLLISIFLCVPVFGALLFHSIVTPVEAKILAEKESLYQHIKVLEMEKGERQLRFNEGGGIQSVYNPTKIFTGYYYDAYPFFMFDQNFQDQKKLQVLVIGYAGGTIGKLFHALKEPGVEVQIDGVEIDEEVTALSEKYMGVTSAERAIFTQDGRSYLRSTSKKYDLIIIDAYTREHYIPPHLITVEFFAEVASHLSPKGRVLFNLNAKGEDSELLQRTENTLLTHFSHVHRAPFQGTYNFLITAGKEEIAFNDPRTALPQGGKILMEDMKKNMRRITQHSGVEIFTDNKNPVEHLTNSDIFSIFRGD